MIELRLATIIFACGLASACAGPGEGDGMLANADYTARHPIELREDATKLDILATHGLDARARAQVAEFAAAYQRTGTGPIVVLLPAGTPRDKDYRRQFDDIRRVLVQSGLRGSIKLGAYPVTDPRLAAPVQLSFTGLKARVPGPCGQWPEDLASGSSPGGMSNAQYHNFGCAYQSMIAAQAADPRDLAGKRASAPGDADLAARPVANLRRGVDPATNWQAR